MKRIISAIAVVLTSVLVSFSQNVYKDVIHLKNGSTIKGIITEYVVGETIKIKTQDGSTISHKIDEITKFTREEVGANDKQTTATPMVISTPAYSGNSTSKAVKERKSSSSDDFKIFTSSLELGSAFAERFTTFSFDYVARFQLMPEFSIGVGTGVTSSFTQDYWDEPTIGVPVFLALKSTFLRSKVSPYLSVDLGGVGLFPTSGAGESTFDFYFNPMVGVQFKTSNYKSISLGVGYLSMGENTGQFCVKLGFNL